MIISNYRGPREPVPEVESDVWSCTNETCNGWMRADFTFDDHPSCPLCKSDMKMEKRVLPVIR